MIGECCLYIHTYLKVWLAVLAKSKPLISKEFGRNDEIQLRLYTELTGENRNANQIPMEFIETTNDGTICHLHGSSFPQSCHTIIGGSCKFHKKPTRLNKDNPMKFGSPCADAVLMQSCLTTWYPISQKWRGQQQLWCFQSDLDRFSFPMTMVYDSGSRESFWGTSTARATAISGSLIPMATGVDGCAEAKWCQVHIV